MNTNLKHIVTVMRQTGQGNTFFVVSSEEYEISIVSKDEELRRAMSLFVSRCYESVRLDESNGGTRSLQVVSEMLVPFTKPGPTY
jgi:hypothetical protein